MSAAKVIADRLDECFDHVPGEDEEHFPAECALEALAEAGLVVVELPEEHFAGDYAVVHIEADEIHIDVGWIDNTDDARTLAAALLRAADQLDKQRAEEFGPDGDEPDAGAAADRAHDAAVDRGLGVL